MNKRLSNIKGKKNDSNTYTSFTSSVIRDRFLQRTQNQIQTTWPGPVGGSPAWWVRLTWKKCHRDQWPLQHVWEYSIDLYLKCWKNQDGVICTLLSLYWIRDLSWWNATNAPIAGVLPQALIWPLEFIPWPPHGPWHWRIFTVPHRAGIHWELQPKPLVLVVGHNFGNGPWKCRTWWKSKVGRWDCRGM